MTQQSLFKDYVQTQRVERDRALDSLEVRRAYLINLAKDIALRLVKQNGQVTGSEVLLNLREECPELVLGVDPRFMGAVFRKGWVRIGFNSVGSHCRPVSVWKLGA